MGDLTWLKAVCAIARTVASQRKLRLHCVPFVDVRPIAGSSFHYTERNAVLWNDLRVRGTKCPVKPLANISDRIERVGREREMLSVNQEPAPVRHSLRGTIQGWIVQSSQIVTE